MQSIVLGGGCFWCLEAVFQRAKGVSKVISGYADGNVPNPNYKMVCAGQSGYAEVVKIDFDEKIISLSDILEIFWTIHDPTTLNRQGNDVGTQYRSIILYYSDEQKLVIDKSLAELQDSKQYPKPVVTQIKELKEFYPAEDYHQDYFNNNTSQSYCRVIIEPKIKKFLNKYPTKVLD